MEIEQVVTCDCCGLKEDCTQFYISEVKAKFEGKWLCGLCSEAVRDEAKRSKKPLKGLEEALNAHMSFCRKFKANPAIRVADGMRLMLRRRSSDVSASSSSSSSASSDKKYGRSASSSQVLLVTGLNREWGISDEWFAIGDSLIITVLGQASFMPVLVLAAKLCPEGMEATLFATLMSISNGGSLLGGLIGAGLTQLFGVTKDSFNNLSTLIILCNLSSLLPLPLLRLLPQETPDSNSETTDMELKSN